MEKMLTWTIISSGEKDFLERYIDHHNGSTVYGLVDGHAAVCAGKVPTKALA